MNNSCLAWLGQYLFLVPYPHPPTKKNQKKKIKRHKQNQSFPLGTSSCPYHALPVYSITWFQLRWNQNIKSIPLCTILPFSGELIFIRENHFQQKPKERTEGGIQTRLHISWGSHGWPWAGGSVRVWSFPNLKRKPILCGSSEDLLLPFFWHQLVK